MSRYRTTRGARTRVVVALGVVALTAGGTAVASAATEEETVSGTASASALGNPLVVPVPLPVDPATVPRGPSPDKHLYVTTSAGQAVSYAAAEFQLPENLAGNKLVLTFTDDSAVLENNAAEAAALAVCALPGQINKAAPDAAVPYDCVVAVRGARAAVGTWTFEADQLASTVSRSGRLGLAVVPVPASPSESSTVAILRDSVKVTYTGTVGQDSLAGVPVPVVPPVAGPSAVSPSDSGLSSGPAPVAGMVPDGSTSVPGPALAPAQPNPQVALTATDVVTSGSSTTSGSGWRSLLLLLVPVVPYLVLSVFGRIAGADQDPTELMARYPGLASLSR